MWLLGQLEHGIYLQNEVTRHFLLPWPTAAHGPVQFWGYYQ